MARTPQSTLTCTMRSSEHAAHRLLMHSGHTSHLWLKVSPCVSFHVIHACALVSCSLSVSPHPSFYFLVLFLFQLYLMSNSAPDEFSIEDPLCNSSLGSMVTLDCVTPLTEAESNQIKATTVNPNTQPGGNTDTTTDTATSTPLEGNDNDTESTKPMNSDTVYTTLKRRNQIVGEIKKLETMTCQVLRAADSRRRCWQMSKRIWRRHSRTCRNRGRETPTPEKRRRWRSPSRS